MKKGKEKSNTVTVEIDYDKLASAIVEANKQSNKAKKIRTPIRTFLMGMCNGCLYSALCFYTVLQGIKMWKNYFETGKPSVVVCIVASLAALALAILFFLAQQETFNDDESEVFSHFNTNISLAALIIALAALLKGGI